MGSENVVEYLVPDIEVYGSRVIVCKRDGYYYLEDAVGFNVLSADGRWLCWYDHDADYIKKNRASHGSIKEAYDSIASDELLDINTDKIWKYLAGNVGFDVVVCNHIGHWTVEDRAERHFLGEDLEWQGCSGVLTQSKVPMLRMESFVEAYDVALSKCK